MGAVNRWREVAWRGRAADDEVVALLGELRPASWVQRRRKVARRLTSVSGGHVHAAVNCPETCVLSTCERESAITGAVRDAGLEERLAAR